MEWEKAQEIRIWFTGHKYTTSKPDINLENPEYRIMDSGVMIKGLEEGKINFFPYHRILEVSIKL